MEGFYSGYKEERLRMVVPFDQHYVTSWCELRTLAGAAVVVSVFGAELASRVGEAAGFAGGATEPLNVEAR